MADSWATCRHCGCLIYDDRRGVWRHQTNGRMGCPSTTLAEPDLVTPSRTDKQPPDSSSVTKGGQDLGGSDA